jgi:hypothetical protein
MLKINKYTNFIKSFLKMMGFLEAQNLFEIRNQS